MTDKKYGMWGVGFSFVTGVLIGGMTGILYAPQSGVRTRRKIVDLAADMRERAGEIADDARGVVTKVVDHGRRVVNG